MKNSQFGRLAIDGGKPQRASYLAYGRQSIAEEDVEAVKEVLLSAYLTRGPKTKAFEEEVARRTQFSCGVAFSSATAALHALMSLFNIDEKSKVLLPSITFAATANCVRYLNGQVVFGDVDPSNLNLDASQLPENSDCKLVIGVDFAGQPCEYSKFRTKMSAHQSLVADAAHSLGADPNYWKDVDFAVFSFHPVKSITAGEGGMIVCRNKEAGEFLRHFRNHGIQGELRPGYSPQKFLGFNYHMTELQAALGLSQLMRLESFIEKRREIAQLYFQELADLSDFLKLPNLASLSTSAWHLFPIRLELEALRVGRDRFLEALRAENIGAQVHYLPVYWHPYYQELGYKRGLCPVAEREYQRILSIPIFPDMQMHDVEDVCLALRKLCQAFKK